MNIFLGILLFIICLSTLIMVHEAGHLTAAKIFKVYCDDFSIGFGKALIHHKRKGGETYFSLRIVPFGGFVSMADKEGELPSGAVVTHDRTMAGLKKWKAAIIMAAGVTMNFILALVLLFINNVFFDVKTLYTNCITVKENSIAETVGIKSSTFEHGKFVSGDLILYEIDDRNTTSGSQIYYFDTRAFANFEDDSFVPIYGCIMQNELSYSSACSYDAILKYYGLTIDAKADYEVQYTAESKNALDSPIKSITLNPYFYQKKVDYGFCVSCHTNHLLTEFTKVGENYYCDTCDPEHKHNGYVVTNSILKDSNPFEIKVTTKEGKKVFEEIGLSMTHVAYKQYFGEAVGNTFKQFGEGASMIFKGIGNLFIGKGWEQTGGIIAIYSQSASVLGSMGFGYYLYYWGLISINLGIVNLLPFPGLDGWQLLVLAIEGITRKKMPDKAKAIASYIGIGLLFILMAALIVKDIIGFF